MLFSCREGNKIETTKTNNLPKNPTETGKHPGYKNISHVVGEKELLRYWAAAGTYYPNLHFTNNDTLYFEFNGQCEYSFPFKMQYDSIVVYWDLQENCTHDIGIKKTFGLRDRPMKGKPFMTLRLINDTTLQQITCKATTIISAYLH